MKSTWLLLFGIAIGALGSGTYVASYHKQAASDELPSVTQPRADSSKRPAHKPLYSDRLTDRNRSSNKKQSTVSDSQASRSPNQESAPVAGARPAITNVPRPTDEVAEPSREELELAAGRIQNRANRELGRLTRLLDLSDEQQNRIFPLLARSSTSYHPALAIQVGDSTTSAPAKAPADTTSPGTVANTTAPEATSPGSTEPLPETTADEEIYDVLTDEQQATLEDEIVDEDLWWTDIVDDLEDELDESAEIAPEEDTGYEGNTGIGGLLQQAAE